MPPRRSPKMLPFKRNSRTIDAENPLSKRACVRQRLSNHCDMLRNRIVRDAAVYFHHQRGGSSLDCPDTDQPDVDRIASSSSLEGMLEFLNIMSCQTQADKVRKDNASTDGHNEEQRIVEFTNKESTTSAEYCQMAKALRSQDLDPHTRHVLENKVMERLDYLKSRGMLASSRLPKCIEPDARMRPSPTTASLADEIRWFFVDWERRRKLRDSMSAKLSSRVKKHFAVLERNQQAVKQEEYIRTRRLAAGVSKEIGIFWRNVQKIHRYKLKLRAIAERHEALAEHLGILVEQSKILTAQIGCPGEEVYDTGPKKSQVKSRKRRHTISRSEDCSAPSTAADNNSSPFHRLTSDALTTTHPSPFLLKYPLREYQRVGFNWLAKLHRAHVNGILADEMGLGKTIQTIALLAHLACHRNIWGPFLIVAPASVVLNWELEFKKWCPAFKILTYYGSVKERKEKRKGWRTPNSFHVCITSYALACCDARVFKACRWKMLILDEAQYIKNFKSRRWNCLLGFNASRRLLLTGTPLQNSLMELWSFMHFLMPELFTSHDEFRMLFSTPMTNMIEGSAAINEKLISQLHEILRPFILRRLKSEVETQLPKKFEHIIVTKLSRRQKFLYEEFMNCASTQEIFRTWHSMRVIGVLMQLRKVCNHPDLFEPRPVISPFAMYPLSYSVHGLVVDCLDRKPVLERIIELGCNANQGDVEMDGSSFSKFVDDVSIPNDAMRKDLLMPFRSSAEKTIYDFVRSSCGNNFGLSSDNAKIRQTQMPGCPDLSTEEMTSLDPIQRMMRRHAHISRNAKFRSSDFVLRHALDGEYYALSRLRELLSLDGFLRIKCDGDTESRNASNSEVIRSLFTIVESMVLDEIPKLFFERIPLYIPAVHTRTIRFNIPKNSIVDLPYPVMPSQCLQMNPPLIQFPDSRYVQQDSGKLIILNVLLRKLRNEHHRVIIFTQMTRMLDILEIFLSNNKMKYVRLDGSVGIERRQGLVESFNKDERIFCFISSTRSGGLGINLTGADCVIFYDSDWNPSSDAQAQDRCHRIGQTRDVHIYRLVSEYTIEQNILKKATQKRILGNVTIDGLSSSVFNEKHSIRELFNADDYLTAIDGNSLSENMCSNAKKILNDKEFQQATDLVEDETDVKALKSMQIEADAGDGEFRWDSDGSVQEDDEVKQCKMKINEIDEDRTPIEMYALKFVETNPDLFSAGKNQQAHQLEIELIRRECELSRARFENGFQNIDSSNDSDDMKMDPSLSELTQKVTYTYQGFKHLLCTKLFEILSKSSDTKKSCVRAALSVEIGKWLRDGNGEVQCLRDNEQTSATEKQQYVTKLNSTLIQKDDAVSKVVLQTQGRKPKDSGYLNTSSTIDTDKKQRQIKRKKLLTDNVNNLEGKQTQIAKCKDSAISGVPCTSPTSNSRISNIIISSTEQNTDNLDTDVQPYMKYIATPPSDSKNITSSKLDSRDLNTPPADSIDLNTPPADSRDLNTPPADSTDLNTPPADSKKFTAPPPDSSPQRSFFLVHPSLFLPTVIHNSNIININPTVNTYYMSQHEAMTPSACVQTTNQTTENIQQSSSSNFVGATATCSIQQMLNQTSTTGGATASPISTSSQPSQFIVLDKSNVSQIQVTLSSGGCGNSPFEQVNTPIHGFQSTASTSQANCNLAFANVSVNIYQSPAFATPSPLHTPEPPVPEDDKASLTSPGDNVSSRTRRSTNERQWGKL